jgi:hypothetical protein
MPGLAAASNFLDLTSGAGPVIHKDALAGRQVALRWVHSLRTRD